MTGTVVFTGPATLSSGQTILRGQLKNASKAAGLAVANSPQSVRNADYVVASRTDTVKAIRAVENGKLVLTYDQYVRHLADLGVDALDAQFAVGVKENPIVDALPVKTEWTPTDETGASVL